MSIVSVRLRRTAPHPAGCRPPLPARFGGAALALGLLAAPAALHAQPVRSDLVMTNGTVSAEVIAGDTLYIGGSFTNAGAATGCGVPVDTAAGQPATGFPAVTGTIRAAVPDGAGGWFIGGSFTSVGGQPRLNLAHVLADLSVAAWDPAPDQAVHCLARQGAALYAGGDFLAIGGAARARIAALDPLTGLALAWDPGADGSVRALVATDSVLYAGGSFLTVGGAARARLAALDLAGGTASPWDPGANSAVFALAARAGVVYVGGFFSSLGGQTRIDLGAVDAATGLVTAWNPQPDNQVLALAAPEGRVYVGGAFTKFGSVTRNRIAALDPVTGQPVESWNPNANEKVLALAVDGPRVYVGGEFTAVGGQVRTYVAALDSASALAVAWNPSAYGPVRALAPGGDRIYVGGSFNGIGGAIRRSLAAIDLATGAVTPWDPGTNGQVLALARQGGSILAGGLFTTAGGQPRNNLAAIDQETGSATAWDPGAGGTVSALAVSGSTVYAGGIFTTIGGQPRDNLASLDATTGLASPWNPDVDGQVYAIVPRDGTVYFGGAFSTVGGLTRHALAAADAATGSPTSWDPSSNGTVRALVPTCGAFYVGGFFTSVGGQPRNRVALLDAAGGSAAAWNPNADGPVFALALHGGALYASGLFGSIGGQPRSRLVSLHPTTGLATAWNPGADNITRAFAAAGGTLYAGGSFATLGGKTVSGLAGVQSDTTLSCPSVTLSPASLPTGRVGEAYQQTVSAAGGAAPYCYASTSGALPPGIALNPSSGELAGTPATAGSFSFTVTATDATGCAGARAYEVVLFSPCPELAFLPATLPFGQVDSAYAETLAVSAGTPPFTFSLGSGTLPAGITLSPAGELSGTPSAVGTFAFTVAVADSTLCRDSTAYALSVFPACTAIAVAPALLPTGAVGQTFDQTFTAAGGRPPYTWSIAAGALPEGLALDPATGRLQGTPAVADTFPITVAAADSLGCTGMRDHVLTIYATPPASSVAADATGLLISNGHPCVAVPMVYTRGESTPAGSVRVTFTLDITRIVLCTPATPSASIRPGPWLDGYANTSFAVADEGGGTYTVDVGLIGEPCGITGGGSLFTLDLTAAGPDGSGTITVTSVRVRDCLGALVPVAPGPPAALAIDRQPLALRPAALPGGSVGDPYAVVLTTDSGTAPFAWTVLSGSLPPGLALDGASGALAGTPTAVVSSYFTVAAEDVQGRTGTRSYSLPIFATAPASFVSAAAAGRCITRAHPQVAVPFAYARVDSTPARAVSVTFQLDAAKLALATPAAPEASVHAGSWFSGYPKVLLVTDNGDGSYTVDASLLGAPCGIKAGGELFTVDLAAAGADGEGAIEVTEARVRDCVNTPVPVTAGPTALLTVDLAGPAPVTELTAAPLTVAGSSDSTTGVALNWDPGAVGPVDLYRAPRGTYPLYTDAVPPPDSSLAPGGPWVRVATNPAPGFVDQPPARGVWDYLAVVTDSCGATAISNRTPGTLDYLLGDVSNGLQAGTGNNSVGTEDISLLGAHYGITGPAAVDPVGYLDVAPTLSGMPDSRPLPDHQIDFEDLFIFAANYGLAAGSPAPLQWARAGRAAPALAPSEVAAERFAVVGPSQAEAGTEVTASLQMAAGGRLQAFSARLAWDATVVEPIGTESSGFVEAQGGVVLSPRPGTVDAALLGLRAGGMTGEGTVARVRFRALRTGAPGIRLGVVDGRDAANRRVPVMETTSAPAVPGQTVLLAPTPNPARGSVALSYTLASPGAVALAVYEVGGRCVRTLASGVQEAAAYRVAWDGRDGDGREVAPGVYYVSLDADGRHLTRTLVLLR